MNKNSRRKPFVLLLVCIPGLLAAYLGAPLEARGQNVQMPSGVSRPFSAIPSKYVARPWRVWMAAQGVVPRVSPESTARPAGKPLGFLEQAFIALRHPANATSEFILLCETEGPDSFDITRLIGWVHESELLQTNMALPITKNGKAMPVHRKGMAVITKESLEQFKPRGVPPYGEPVSPVTSGGNPPIEKAVLFRAPRLPTNTEDLKSFVTEIPLSSFYFVYAETPNFVLVGTSERFKPESPADVVLGWLPQSNHESWNNRIGYEWNLGNYSTTPTKSPGKRLERGFVFQTAADAFDFLKNPAPLFNSAEPPGALFAETITDGAPMRLADSSMRMPLLEDTVIAGPNGKSLVAKVGWLGGRAVDEATLATTRRKLEELAAQSRTLNVMFLIDHTQTMETHFPTVADAVQHIVTDLRKNYLEEAGIYQREMRVSISFYGDEDSDAKAVIRDFAPVKAGESTAWTRLSAQEKKSWAASTSLSVNDMLAELPRHPTFGGGGIEEDVLLGLHKGIKKFPVDEGRKLLFLIGDMGDKSLLGEKFQQRRDVIARLLADERSPIWLVALHVRTAATDSENGKEVGQLFHDQMRDVVDVTRKRLRLQDASLAEQNFSKVVPLSAKPPTEEIMRAYQAMQADIERYQRALRNADPSQLTKRELARLAAQKISLDSVRHPLFSEGYVAHQARSVAVSDSFVPTEQITRRVLASSKDIENMRLIIRSVLDAVEKEESSDLGIGELIRKEIAIAYGEADSLVSLKEAFELRANLRVNSPIFSIPFNEFGKRSVQPKDIERLRACDKRLGDIEKGIAREWIVQQNPVKKNWEVVAGGPANSHDRHFLLPRDPYEFRWYWLYEHELP